MDDTFTIRAAAITCHVCGTTSQNPLDVQFRYCTRCGLFHRAPQPGQVARLGKAADALTDAKRYEAAHGEPPF